MTTLETDEIISPKHLSEWDSLLPGKTLILSIETTGLKPDNSELFMIGTLSFTVGNTKENEPDEVLSVKRKQWLIHALHEERTAILEFLEMLRRERYDRIITFYGSTFDLRFPVECLREFGLYREAEQLENYPNMELSKVLRPFRKALDLTDNRQQSFESIIGYRRNRQETSFQISDLYRTGRELYYVQKGIKGSFPEDVEEVIFEYNRDKLFGIFHMLPLLFYVKISEPGDNAPVLTHEISEYQGFLEIRGESLYPVLLPLTYQEGSLRVDWNERQFVIRLSIYRGELKLFFRDYKNYYYLPLEDTAIHKKLGSLVDSAHRKPATKETCYQKKSGIFLPENPSYHTDGDLPQYGPDHISYRESYDSVVSYRDYSEDFLYSEESLYDRNVWIGGLLLFALQS
ncbi:MAG: ribonuclease H-like domain-containing protein [Lachnospiraceae bacterium]|nr:ribonuclease H-like domain-containing protein [Lachnospiraceae bacterium]